MVQSASYDPIVVEPEITDEKIRELLARGTESAKLDYKSNLDVTDTRQKVQLAKHVMAMANTAGGYLLVGAKDDGSLAMLKRSETALLDEATVRAQVAGYCDLSIPTFVDNGREVDGSAVAIITVLPLSDHIAVAGREGNYAGGCAFRVGDVLVRHGSASERWTQADAEYIVSRVMKARKAEWLKEFATDYRFVGELRSGRSIPRVDRATLELPPDEFKEAIVKLLRLNG